MHEPPELIFEFGREFAEWICRYGNVCAKSKSKKNREYYFAPSFNFIWVRLKIGKVTGVFTKCFLFRKNSRRRVFRFDSEFFFIPA